ncbi:DUF2855 family protein [Shewanella sp. UCD-KL21]|uniref:DUF2855 family protein n=1 Tax=Shewanella sp. UCD-KL21 TaxID=1917164 RepID=UPI000970F77F|nr:DUF2855 family protein [Shewanella sp. UCD-KL21]
MESHTRLNHAVVFEVAKSKLTKTRVVSLNTTTALADDEVLLKIDKFALTANNISYGITGDSLGYWRFFPTEKNAEQAQWGQLPVMGFAEVVASNNQQIRVGERVWGFVPMASHLKIIAGNINSSGFSDRNPCREGLAPVYSRFDRVASNPFYKQTNEDFDILLRGLFTTSWLVDDFMFDNHYFGAEQYLITSASSKTSIALAFAIKRRNDLPTIGITSQSNCQFVAALGCYDQVISYQQITSLQLNTASILVDMAGSKTILTAIHQHFADKIKYSCLIGATHHQDININDNFKHDALPGAVPTFFFAPTHIKKRTLDWGASQTMQQINLSLLQYIEFCRSKITINHTDNINQLETIYQQVLAGKTDPSVGQIVSL